MGTTYSVKLVFNNTKYEMNMINKSIDSILINLNQQMSTWIEDSEISLFNKSLSVTPYKISDDLMVPYSIVKVYFYNQKKRFTQLN